MANDYRQEDVTTDHPEEVSGYFWAFDGADIRFSVGFLCVVLLASLLLPYGRLCLLVGIAAWVVWMRPYDYGRPYYLYGEFWLNAWIRYVKKGVISDGTAHRWAKKRSQPRIPMGVLALGSLGLLRFAQDKTEAIMFKGEGSDIASLNPEDQNGKLDEFADLTNRIATINNGSFGISTVLRSRPCDVTAIAATYAENVHPDIIRAKETDPNNGQVSAEQLRYQRLRVNGGQLIDMARAYCADTDEVIVITVHHGKLLRSAVKFRKISLKKLNKTTAQRIVDIAEPGLAAWGVTNPRVLDRSSMRDFIRGAWDIKHLSEYYLSRMRGETQAEDSTSHWPQKRLVVGYDWCEVDGTFHTTLRIRRVRGKLSPWEVRRVYGFPSVVKWFSVALVGEAVSYEREYWWQSRQNKLSAEALSKMGYETDDPRSEARTEARKARQVAIYEAGYTENYHVLAVVSANDQEELEKVREAAKTHINSIPYVKCEVIVGECRQLPALWSGTTGIKML